MPSQFTCRLENRSVLEVSGPDSRAFLQGLITNDINKVSPANAVYAAFLTPQGKYLFDFFIAEVDGALLLDVERGRMADFHKRLRMYKLRADVAVTDRGDDFSVWTNWGKTPADAPGSAMADGGGVRFVDPRLADAGWRAIVPAGETPFGDPDAQSAGAGQYDAHRLALGLPDSSRDMIVDKSILLECGLDELNGIDWDKGCYMGQEVTARSKYRGLVKKRLLPMEINGDAPEAGTALLRDGKQAGEMRSSAPGQALALIKLDYLGDDADFDLAGHPDSSARVKIPGWMSLPAADG